MDYITCTRLMHDERYHVVGLEEDLADVGEVFHQQHGCRLLQTCLLASCEVGNVVLLCGPSSELQ